MTSATRPTREIVCDIAIVGGSLGGCAAALLLQTSGLTWALIHDDTWLGGQLTAQGVAAPDEHAYIETFGAPQSYYALREAIRQHYQAEYNAPALMETSVLGPHKPLNPGNGWVSRLCFEPHVAVTYFDAALGSSPHVYRGCRLVAAEREDTRLVSLIVETAQETLHIRAAYYLDATDTGDLLPLTHTAYVTGAEAQRDTGEPSAASEARPQEIQSFTACFAVEYCPGEDHTIPAPEGYADFRDRQPYTLAPLARDGTPIAYRMFAKHGDNLPFWSYRRLYDGALLGKHDIALINWVSNDYYGKSILDVPPEERDHALDEARRLSLGFLYWLQTECPRDEGGTGYPELKLRPDVMGTEDGLSQQPYIRESRRIVAHTRIVEQDITTAFHPGARARHWTDSVGIGWYSLDLHPCVGNPQASRYAATRPFQIPLGALIPQTTENLLAACKNIGTTHLTNGAYRLHPIEWAIGAAAAGLAAYSHTHALTPAQILADGWHIWRLQYQLVRAGCPVVWAVDVPLEHPCFLATQLLIVKDVIVPDSPRWHRLEIGLDEPLGDSIDRARLQHLIDDLEMHTTPAQRFVTPAPLHPDTLWKDLCRWFTVPLEAALNRKDDSA